MSRKGNCIDNAPMESFFGHMKDEIEFKSCETLEDVIKVVSKYIKEYKNQRICGKHQGLWGSLIKKILCIWIISF